jgi:eukaryotic-like serine/threonine-protein kinase
VHRRKLRFVHPLPNAGTPAPAAVPAVNSKAPSFPRARDRASQLVGKTLAERYRVDAVLAAGGMGTVYRGTHVAMRKRVAIKVLRPDVQGFTELSARFEREAIAGAHVVHANVAAATDFGRLADGTQYLVMELVEGITLHELIRLGPMPAARAAFIARQLAAGLDACHRTGVIHRDLKPRNVMIDLAHGDRVKIIDFGLSRLRRASPATAIDDEEEAPVSSRPPITLRGFVFGTIAYMSPETALGMDAVDERSDLYALGVILYEMLAGRRPFAATTAAELFAEQRAKGAPPIAARAPGSDVPPALEALAHRLLSRDPEARGTARDIAVAIDAAMGMATAATPTPAPSALATPLALARPLDRPSSSGSLHAAAAEARVSSLPPQAWSPAPTQRPVPSAPSLGGAVEIAAPAPWRRRLPRWAVAAAATALALAAATPALRDAAGTPTPPVALRAGAAPPFRDAASHAGGQALDAIEADAWRERFLAARDAKDTRGLAIAFLALAARDPGAFADAALRAPLPALAARLAVDDDDRADEVFTTLAERIGSPGLDVLYDIASSRGGSKAARRAEALLAREGVRARASVALAVTLELRAARCADKPALFVRAAAEGDLRTLRVLERLRAPDACRGDGQCCWYGDPRLGRAAREIGERARRERR